MKKVNNNTRAGASGKYIVCPECRHTDKVYHFAWSALTCNYCKNDFISSNAPRVVNL